MNNLLNMKMLITKFYYRFNFVLQSMHTTEFILDLMDNAVFVCCIPIVYIYKDNYL